MTRTDPPPAALRPHATSARRQPLAWGLLACGGLFLALGLLPVRLCGALPCPGWVQPFEIALGVVVGLGALLVLALDTRRGSRVDLDRARLVWWTGPAERHELPLDRVVRASLAGDTLRFVDRDGGLHLVPADCVRPPAAAFLAALATVWPHVAVE